LAGVAILLAAVGTGCQAAGPPSLPGRAALVDVAMHDYNFTSPPVVPRGRVVFRAANAGRVQHELVLVSLPADFPLTIDAQLHSEQRRAFPPVGLLPPRAPGRSGAFAVDVSPGRYAMICFVRDPDGRQHSLKGMSAEFRVR